MRHTTIAMINDATHRYEYGLDALELAKKLGFEVYTKSWSDSYTNAQGRYFAVRTRHLKRHSRAVRRLLSAQT